MIDPIVAAALADPAQPDESTIEAAGIPFHVLAWGDPDAPRVLLIHGVTSNARTWWRVGPAIAAAGYRVIAPDLPGHGKTGHWAGHVAFRDTARDVAAFARAAMPGDSPADVRVVGHSWGGMTAAAFPSAGYAPLRLVLVDPPTLPLAVIRHLLEDPSERRYEDIGEAMAAVGALHPTWGYGDVVAKAEGLTQFDEPAVLSVLTENGDWDGGLAALADPAAGGLFWDAAVPAFAARLGAEHITTIGRAPHSPQRTHPVETTDAILRALA